MPKVAIPSAAGGLFAGGFPKLRTTKGGVNQREKSEVAVEPPALPSRPKPQSNTNTFSPTGSGQSGMRKPPPPVPPRLATTPIKTKPSVTNQSVQQDNIRKSENVVEPGNFLSQVKLRPTGVLKSPKENTQTPINQPPTKSEPRKFESKPIQTTGKIIKQEPPKESPKINSSFDKLKMNGVNREIIDLPPVPRDFSGKPKEYPSGAKKGFFINNCNNINTKANDMAQLEKELKEAAMREDFENCVELKKKISQLKLC